MGTETVIKAIHWNVESKLWTNKLIDLELLLDEKCPDTCFVSEANLWDNMEDYDCNIPGYYIVLPSTMVSLKHARIILLVKNGLDVHVLREHMDTDTATIWIRIGSSKSRSVIIGGIYREHQQLGAGNRDS